MKRKGLVLLSSIVLLTGCNGSVDSNSNTESDSVSRLSDEVLTSKASDSQPGESEKPEATNTSNQDESKHVSAADEDHKKEIRGYIDSLKNAGTLDYMVKAAELFDSVCDKSVYEEESKNGLPLSETIRRYIADGEISYDNAKIVLDDMIEAYPELSSDMIDAVLLKANPDYLDCEAYITALYYYGRDMQEHTVSVVVSESAKEAESKFGGKWEDVSPKEIKDEWKEKAWSFGEISVEKLLEAYDDGTDIFFTAKKQADETYSEDMNSFAKGLSGSRIAELSFAGYAMLCERYADMAVVGDGTFELVFYSYYN